MFCTDVALGLDDSTEETAVDRCSGMDMEMVWSVLVVGVMVTETGPDLSIGCLEIGSHCSVIMCQEGTSQGIRYFHIPNVSSLAADAAVPLALSQ